MRLLEILDAVDTQDLDVILGIIYSCYLSNREKNLYNMMTLHVAGKSQVELSILFSMYQDKVSVYLARLRKKLRRIYSTLVHRTDELRDLYKYLELELSVQQLQIIELLLMGHKQIRISEQLNCSPAHITKVISRIYEKIPAEKSIQVEDLISALE